LTSERTTVAVPGSPVPASAIPRLRAIAGRAAKENGDAVPSWISAVVTTQEKAPASATPGAEGPGGKTVVYLVTMKGHFKFDRSLQALGPQGREPRTHAPALNYQYLVVSAKTFAVIAWGLSPKPPPVAPSSLGPVTWLKQQARHGVTLATGTARARGHRGSGAQPGTVGQAEPPPP
jgi:hypothetical protein